MALEKTLTSRDEINNQLRACSTRRPAVGDSRQPRGAEGGRPAQLDQGHDGEADAGRPREAGGDPHRRGPQAVADSDRGGREAERHPPRQGQREALILQAEGQAKAIDTVFKAIHEGNPDPKLLAYQYLQMLPQIAQGDHKM